MTEELISTLSKVGGLKIIARTSIMGYKKSNKKINEIANELGVNAILEGSVRKSGEKLRITVQLIDSKSTDYIWSETYDRSFEDIFAIQSDIANKVSQTLRVQLLTNWPQLRQKSTESTEAYTHYLKGRYFWNQRELDGFNRALKEFESAIAKDPGLPEPHVTLAAIKQEYEWKWEEAETEFKDAIALNPSNSIAHSWYALCLGHMGRIDEGIKEGKLAQELDPLSPRAHCAASEE